MLVISDSTYMFFTILAIIVAILLIVGIFFLIKHNMKRYSEESNVILNDALSRTQIKRTATKYINKVGVYGACSFLYVDLDAFSDLNELLGRKACDEILKQVALKLVRVLPFNASISLYNNDEFLIFIKEQNDKDYLEKIAKKVCESVNTEYHVTVAADINLTCSVGCATYPLCGTTFNELLTNLELATYISKRDGGNKFTTYYSTLSSEEKENYEFYLEIKKAIKNKEFVLYYQPMINIDKNTIFGAEALMRWNHPTQGIVSPAKFIPILEQSGDIRWVGEWGIEMLVKEYLSLSSKYPEFDIKLSLNLSTKQLLDQHLSQQFIDIVKKYGVEPNHFMLEVGEYTAYDRLGQVKNNLLKLRDYGFLVAVDGFDLDETALTDIERAPIDIIKLDRSFLAENTKQSIKEKFVALLVEYAKNYDHELICEGVENQEMVDYIKAHNIHYAQGYFYSKPMSVEDFDSYIANRKWRDVNKAQYMETNIPAKEEVKAAPTPAPEKPQESFTTAEKTVAPTPTPEVKKDDTLDFLEGIDDNPFKEEEDKN